MATPAMKTSFDEICAASLQRHYAIREIVSNGLMKYRPQSDQSESELQKLLDKATEEMRDYLLDEVEGPHNTLSAECYAEYWDYMLWSVYSKFTSRFIIVAPSPHDVTDIFVCRGHVQLGRGRGVPVQVPRV